MKSSVKYGLLPAAVFLAAGCAPTKPAPRCKLKPPATATTVDPAGTWRLRWDRGFSGWRPPLFDGGLLLRRDSKGWTGRLEFRQSRARLRVTSVRLEGNELQVRLAMDGKKGPIELRGRILEDRLVGEMRWGGIPWTPLGGRRWLTPRQVEQGLPRADPQTSGVDPVALDRLLARATAEASSAVVILREGRVVTQWYREGHHRPLMAMSATKSVVSMAVGHLVAAGKLSLDTKLASLFPRWKDDPRGDISVRHLLNNTSGLDPRRASFKGGRILEHALSSKLLFKPGSRFQYNNSAADLLAVVFERAAGVHLDRYLERHVLSKMDITGASWIKDADGTPRAAGELIIRPMDLAKLGQLMLNRGTWNGARILSEQWVRASTSASQPHESRYGLLWWLEPDGAGYSARGWLGQFLVVLPKKRLVAVRMRKLTNADKPTTHAYQYASFRADVAKLVK